MQHAPAVTMARLIVAVALVALALAAQATASVEVEQVLGALRGIRALREGLARSLLADTYSANEYSKCLYSDGTCSVNYLYLASSE